MAEARKAHGNDISGLPTSIVTGKPVIHFAHANGMPSRVYTPLFEQLEALFTIEFIPLLGFDDSGDQVYPVDNHWRSLTQHVIDSVKSAKQKHQVPIIGLGHSLGALCTLQAMYKEPNLFAQAVLMDPPLIYGRHNLLWHLAKTFSSKMVDKMSPSGISKHRRDVWDSREQASELLRGKSFFKHFDERTFAGYIEHGLRPCDTHNSDIDEINPNSFKQGRSNCEEGKVTLAIPKEMEVAVFRTNPSWYWLTPNRPPLKPVTLLIGEQSQFYQRKFPQKVTKRLSIPFKLHKGGHMFPLEYPDSVVSLIIETISKQA